MTDLANLYGGQLDDVLEAYREAMGVNRFGCELTDIMNEYYERLGLPMDGSNAICVGQKLQGHTVSPVYVRIKLDGYRVEFEHNEGFVVPPPACWERI